MKKKKKIRWKSLWYYSHKFNFPEMMQKNKTTGIICLRGKMYSSTMLEIWKLSHVPSLVLPMRSRPTLSRTHSTIRTYYSNCCEEDMFWNRHCLSDISICFFKKRKTFYPCRSMLNFNSDSILLGILKLIHIHIYGWPPKCNALKRSLKR